MIIIIVIIIIVGLCGFNQKGKDNDSNELCWNNV